MNFTVGCAANDYRSPPRRCAKWAPRQLKQRSWRWWSSKMAALLIWDSRSPKAAPCWQKFNRFWCRSRPRAGGRGRWPVTAAARRWRIGQPINCHADRVWQGHGIESEAVGITGDTVESPSAIRHSTLSTSVFHVMLFQQLLLRRPGMPCITLRAARTWKPVARPKLIMRSHEGAWHVHASAEVGKDCVNICIQSAELESNGDDS